MSWQDILVLLVFALVLLGPKKLPEIARSAGRALTVLRRLSHDFEREVRDVADRSTASFWVGQIPMKRTHCRPSNKPELRLSRSMPSIRSTRRP
jgi:TatA/E family protein of Tat protein translocase